MRTLGETRDCGGCRYWSEMVAMAIDEKGVQALCLNSAGPRGGQYTTATMTCDAWKSGHLGAVDEPPNYGEAMRAAYAAEEEAPKPKPKAKRNRKAELSGPQRIALRNCSRDEGYSRTYVSDHSYSTFDSLEKRGLIELRGIVYVTTDAGKALVR